MTQGFVAIGMGMVMVISSSGIALAGKSPACDVVGDWTATVTGTTPTVIDFQMSSNKKGTSNFANPYCGNAISKIYMSKSKTGGRWSFRFYVAGCPNQANANVTLNSSCNEGAGSFSSMAGLASVTVTQTSAARHSPGRPSTPLMSTLK